MRNLVPPACRVPSQIPSSVAGFAGITTCGTTDFGAAAIGGGVARPQAARARTNAARITPRSLPRSALLEVDAAGGEQLAARLQHRGRRAAVAEQRGELGEAGVREGLLALSDEQVLRRP